MAAIDYFNLIEFDELFSSDKLLIFWHFNEIIYDIELYYIDLDILKQDYDYIRIAIENSEADNLREESTKYLEPVA